MSPAPATAGPCLKPNDVAALRDGRLPAEEHRLLVAHLSACADCRAWVGAAEAADPGAGAGDAPRARGPWLTSWRMMAAAALALVAIGAALFGLSRGADAPTPRERALAVASEAGVALLSETERSDRRPALERGGLTLLTPRGTVLGARPLVSWTVVPGGTSARVTVRDAQGALRLDQSAEGASLSWPAGVDDLPPGTYVARVRVTSPAGEVQGSVAFRVLSSAQAAAYQDALGRIDARAPMDLRALLKAHAALREGLEGEGRRWLLEALADGAPDELLRELLPVAGVEPFRVPR